MSAPAELTVEELRRVDQLVETVQLRAEVERLTQELAAARATGERWRRLVVDLTRCQHGRIQGDRCSSCPDGTAPDDAGRHVGYSIDGTWEVIVPLREQMADPDAWYDGYAISTVKRADLGEGS